METTNIKYAEFNHSFNDPFEKKDMQFTYRFKRPSVMEASRAQSTMMKKPVEALKTLCTDCVHPDDKNKMLEDFKIYAGLNTTFGGALLTSAGFGELGN